MPALLVSGLHLLGYSALEMNASQQAEFAGFDLSLMEENLQCSPERRALQHQEALSLALELERAGRELRERTQPAPAAPHRI